MPSTQCSLHDFSQLGSDLRVDQISPAIMSDSSYAVVVTRLELQETEETRQKNREYAEKELVTSILSSLKTLRNPLSVDAILKAAEVQKEWLDGN